MSDETALRAELAQVQAELEKAQRELRELREKKEEKARERRLRASFASMSDDDLMRIAATAADALQDTKLKNRVREFARLVYTPGETESQVPDPKRRLEILMARERAIKSLREKIVGSLIHSDPTIAHLTALWGARLRQK